MSLPRFAFRKNTGQDECPKQTALIRSRPRPSGIPILFCSGRRGMRNPFLTPRVSPSARVPIKNPAACRIRPQKVRSEWGPMALHEVSGRFCIRRANILSRAGIWAACPRALRFFLPPCWLADLDLPGPPSASRTRAGPRHRFPGGGLAGHGSSAMYRPAAASCWLLVNRFATRARCDRMYIVTQNKKKK